MGLTETKSVGVENAEKLEKVLPNVLTKEEWEQHQFILKRIENAKILKSQRYKYYDGMTYEEDYITNENLKNTFLSKIINIF